MYILDVKGDSFFYTDNLYNELEVPDLKKIE
jgi:hypothetical protein